MKSNRPNVETVVPVEDLEKRLTFFHAKLDMQSRFQVQTWLEQLPALETEIAKWLNASIANTSKAAILRATMSRSSRIYFMVDLDKAATALLSKVKEDQREKIPKQQLIFAFIYLAEEAGYTIVDGKIVVDYTIKDKMDFGAKAKAEARAKSGETSLEVRSEDVVLDEAMVDLADENIEPVLTLIVGRVYANGKGIERKITAIDQDQVSYVVTRSDSKRTRVGAEGVTSARAFLTWAEREVPENGTLLKGDPRS